MKDTKRQFNLFASYDHTGLEKHLEKMASKGWMLEKIGNHFWKYRRIESKALKFSIVFLPNLSESNVIAKDEKENFADFCSAAGWNYVTSSDKMLIFCNEEENPVPIETDASLQVSCIDKSCRKILLSELLLFFVSLIFYIGIEIYSFINNPIDTLSDGDDLSLLLYFFILSLFGLSEYISYRKWYKKAKINADENNCFTETKSKKTVKILFVAFISLILFLFSLNSERFFVFGFAFLLVFICILAAHFLIIIPLRKLFDKKDIPTKTRVKVSVAVSVCFSLIFFSVSTFTILKNTNHYSSILNTFENSDNMQPLTIEDLTETTGKEYTTLSNKEKSIIVQNYYCWQFGTSDHDADIRYEITDFKLPFLYDVFKKHLTEPNEIDIIDGTTFALESFDYINANEIYREYRLGKPSNHFVICWDNRIVDLTFDWEPTDEQISIASEKLMNADI